VSEPFAQHITFLTTRDRARTGDFYERVLGLPLARDQGDCRIYRVSANAFIGFCERASAPEPRGVILTLVSDEVDAWYQRLSAQGIAFDKPPTYNPRYRIYHCFLLDPNGYVIEIQRFDEPLTSE
jgi:catechol 2,3-dioxygenase-like lactoylglutathione lyase family enzyme